MRYDLPELWWESDEDFVWWESDEDFELYGDSLYKQLAFEKQEKSVSDTEEDVFDIEAELEYLRTLDIY